MPPTRNTRARSIRALPTALRYKPRAAAIGGVLGPVSSGATIALPRKPGDEPSPALRVLIVEDEGVIGLLLAEVLIGMGYEICALEATEADAVTAAARCLPDLLIVDAWLDHGDGISAVAQILRSRYVPHLFVSGDAAKVRALRPDAVIIQKPFREQDLARGIERALGTDPNSDGAVPGTVPAVPRRHRLPG